MEVESSTERVIQRPGKENINVKLADNTGKKAETAKRSRPRRKVRRFRNTLGRKNYTGKINIPPRRKNGKFSNDKMRRRQRGFRLRRRGVKIIIRNLSRNATNSDIKSVFEKIGPLKRCGINWNNLGESRGTAEVEFLYRADAFRAVRKLDYKSIKGVPMRLEIKGGQRRFLLNRLGPKGLRRNRSSNGGPRGFRIRSNYKRSSSDSGRRNRSYLNRNSSTRRELRNRNGRK